MLHECSGVFPWWNTVLQQWRAVQERQVLPCPVIYSDICQRHASAAGITEKNRCWSNSASPAAPPAGQQTTESSGARTLVTASNSAGSICKLSFTTVQKVPLKWRISNGKLSVNAEHLDSIYDLITWYLSIFCFLFIVVKCLVLISVYNQVPQVYFKNQSSSYGCSDLSARGRSLVQ